MTKAEEITEAVMLAIRAAALVMLACLAISVWCRARD